VKKLRLVLVAAIIATGCAAPIEVQFDWDKKTDFEKYRTFKWSGVSASDTDPVTQEDKTLMNAVDVRLAGKGLAKVDDSPDLIVTFHAVGEDAALMRNDYDPQKGGTEDWTTMHYKQGTIVLDFTDAKTQERVWRGIAIGKVQRDASPDEIKGTIEKAINKMLKGYPPAES
jgi:hypothetical protein